MRIGIDARLYTSAGLGRYISNLIKELERIDTKNDYIIFVDQEGDKKYHPQSTNFKKWVVKQKPYTLQEQTAFLFELLRAHLDLLHVPHFNVPVLYPGKVVITIHDLIMHNFAGKEASTLTPLMANIKRIGYQLVTTVSVLKSKKILVPSEYVKGEVLKKLKFVKEEKIEVLYEGVTRNLVELAPSDSGVIQTRLEELGIKDRYFLYVGSAYAHKNLRTLVISYKDLLDKGLFSGQLVIAGKIDQFTERLAGFIHALKLDTKVVFAARRTEGKHVPDSDLAYLYKGSMAYVSSSLEEGFGLTPLEAQAFNIPVLVSDIPIHREVLGDSALYMDPKSTIDISNKMLKIFEEDSLRQELVKKGRENIKKYSWEKMARSVFDTYISI